MQADEDKRTQARIAELRQELRDLEGGNQACDIIQDRAHEGATFGAYARAMLAGREALTRYFDPVLFADPAMDILLYLYAEGEDGRAATTTSCCTATRAPRTTALRWIKLVMTHGLIVTEDDPADKRVTLLKLSDGAKQAIEAWFRDIPIVGPGR